MLESHPEIPLERHLTEVNKRILKFCDDNLKADNAFRTAASITALSHDLGKATSYFQNHLKGQKVSPWLSSHALLSAVIAAWHLSHDIASAYKLPIFMAIKSHHSNPTSPSNALNLKHDWDYLQKQAKAIDKKEFLQLLNTIGLSFKPSEAILPQFNEFRIRFCWAPEVKKNKGIKAYFTTNLLLGMLVDADIRAVIDMPANEERKYIPADIVDRYLKQRPRTHSIDELRQEFYGLVTENIKKLGPEARFLSLTAPTGIGKTLAGFSAAVKWRSLIAQKNGRIPRIIYVLPFTSIIDQNYDVLRDVIKKAGLREDIILKHHYRANPSDNTKTKAKDIWKMLEEGQGCSEALKYYEQTHNRVETWDGEIIVTTFVRFYETLFTNRRSEMRRLHRLAGSIVILDEVQNIPAEYWQATEKALKFLADEWDTQFILMTATRPALLQDIPELTEPKKQCFFNKMSRTRLFIEPNPVPYDDIDKWLLPKIKTEIESEKSFMVVLNTVRSAQEVYKALKQRLKDFQLYFLSASLIPVHREQRIQQIKTSLEQGRKIGLIATQVVEAGVDLDFDIVIRDLAPLDAIVQAAGRCNRNAIQENNGQVYLINLIEQSSKNSQKELATYIYSGSLIDATKRLMANKHSLAEKEYLSLVEKYFREVSEIKPPDKNLLDSLTSLNYDELAGFSLIKEKMPQVPVFVEFDEDATRIIERLEMLEAMKISSYDERMRRKQLFKAIEHEIWKYVVNVPVKVVIEIGLGTLPYAQSLLCLRKEMPEFNTIYDKETGFCKNIQQGAIFL